MPTSGVTSWPLTAREIINAALQEAAIIALDEEPEAHEASACLLRLNALLKSWQVGLQLEAEATVTVPPNDASGTLAADVETVVSARVVLSPTNERQLTRFERDDYLSLPNKLASGTPTIFYMSEQATTCTMHLWPVPTVETQIRISYLRTPETVTNLSQTVDFPQKYQEALYAMLAVRCAGLFGQTLEPELVARAERLRIEIEDAERPASYSLGPWY